MPSGNVCKANQTRARNQAKLAGAGHTTSAEDRKKFEASKNAVQCNVCLQGFPCSVRPPELQQHLDSRHGKLNKTIADCFPNYVDLGAAKAS